MPSLLAGRFCAMPSTNFATLSSENPLLRVHTSRFPDFNTIAAEHVVPGLTEILDTADAEFSQLESQFSPCWESTLGARIFH